MAEESEGRECDDVAEKRKKVDRLVDHLETKVCKAAKERFPVSHGR